MELPDFRAMSLSQLRETASKEVRWVVDMGGHVWLSKHGKWVAGVVPFHDVQALEKLRGRDIEEHARDREREYVRMKAALAVESWQGRESDGRA
jgi:antitoxin (DNA-binding transcriptional repressor) of toxin-antitoxin stability system